MIERILWAAAGFSIILYLLFILGHVGRYLGAW
jgi:hypothetical protein